MTRAARDPAIPDLDALVAAVRRGATHHASLIHGESHWKCVAWTGAELARATPGADGLVIFLFALIHDAKRIDDGHDPLHGHRAAALALELHGEHFHLPAEALNRLHDAIHGHVDGHTSRDPTVGACWDADRLNLWRLGMRPLERFLSTEAAKAPEVIDAARRLDGQHSDWPQLLARYVRPATKRVSA